MRNEDGLWPAGGGRLQVKLGINKWQEIQHLDLQRSQELQDAEGQWWEAELNFDDVLYSPPPTPKNPTPKTHQKPLHSPARVGRPTSHMAPQSFLLQW